MATININTDGIVRLTNRLEQLHRSALPVAVMQTLNSAAFDVKTKTMPASAKANFVQRKPNFFKATSKVLPAKGWDINRMQAQVGFTGKDQAVEDLEQQERGGTIDGRSFIPLNTARVGKNSNKPVRPNARLAGIRAINSQTGKGTDKQRFIRAAIKAHQTDSLVIGNGKKALVFRVEEIVPVGTERKGIKFKMTALYTYEKSREVSVKGTGFMASAAEASSKMLEGFFVKHAQKQIAKRSK